MKTKLLGIGVILGIIIMVAGFILPTQSLHFDQDLDDTDTPGAVEMATRIFGFAELLNPDGGVVSENLIQNALSVEGDAVEFLRVKVNWTSEGDELDWSTFMLTMEREIILTDQYSQQPPHSISLPVSTSVYYSGNLEWTENIKDHVVGYFGVEGLSFFGGAKVTYVIDATAQIQDIYGSSITKTGHVEISFVLQWTSPDLTFVFGSDTTTLSGNTVGGALSHLSLVVIGGGIIGIVIIAWRRKPHE